jgi:hypothetical protein
MWAPADINALPTPHDILAANNAILHLEEELVQARLRVKQLMEELKWRRAWIAPVRKLNFDILSLIFEYCGEEEWRSPLQISAVSRLWRDVALATPRAWSFIDTRKEADFDVIRLFFERSGEKLLHIGFSSRIRQDDLPGDFTRKIQCLSIGQFFFGTPLGRIFSTIPEKIPFPNLTRLRVRPGRSGVRFSDLSLSIFPSLRHLEMTGALDDENRIPPPFNPLVFPPLTTLKLTVRENEVWLRVIACCSDSLVSLSIKFTRFLLLEPSRVNLPNLRCLEIMKYTDGDNPSLLTFITPALTTYIEVNEFQDPGKPLHLDTNSVTHMRIDQVPLLSMMPQLRVLQLELSPRNYSSLFDQLGSGSQPCPLLESIEFRFLGEPHFNLGEEKPLKELARSVRPDITIHMTTNKWRHELPGIITNSVRILTQ